MQAAHPQQTTGYLKPLLFAALFLFALAGAYAAWRFLPAGQTTAVQTTTPLNPAIEERWGIRITQIGVTADGGLIDMRYLIIDPDKALAMVSETETMPVLIAEESDTLINSAAAMNHKNEFNAGQTYFFLYRNTNGAIRRGGAVTVRIGDLLLEHVIAR